MQAYIKYCTGDLKICRPILMLLFLGHFSIRQLKHEHIFQCATGMMIISGDSLQLIVLYSRRVFRQIDIPDRFRAVGDKRMSRLWKKDLHLLVIRRRKT